jgi:integrase
LSHLGFFNEGRALQRISNPLSRQCSKENDVRLKIDLSAAVRAANEQPCVELTLSELIAGFNASSQSDYDLRLRKWINAFGQTSAWAITSEQLDAAAQALLAHGYKPSTVNRDLSALGTCYRWAKQHRLSPRGFRSPTLGVQRQSEDIRRVEINADQLKALRSRAQTMRDRRFGVFVALLIDTGARKSELLLRRWSDIDLQSCTITCDTTKTGVPRVLHFRPDIADSIQRIWRSRPSEALLFEGRVPGAPIDYRAAWTTICQDIGRPDLHMHDLRHAAAADLLRSGVTLGVAAQVLGHSPQVLARRYGHLETGALRAAQMQRWGLSP